MDIFLPEPKPKDFLVADFLTEENDFIDEDFDELIDEEYAEAFNLPTDEE